jgi:hypothetical protein
LKNNLESLIENFFYKKENVIDSLKIKNIIIKEYIKHEKNIIEQSEGQKKLINHIQNALKNIDKEEYGILSITPSNKSDMAVVVRFNDKEEIESARSKIKKAIKTDGVILSDEIAQKYDSSIKVTSVTSGDDKVYVVYKFDTGSREGLALEHIMSFLLTKKVTDQLKNRLDLPPDASKEDIIARLKGDYKDLLKIAIEGKKLVLQQIGEIKEAESIGSINSKADLILTAVSGERVGLSIKLVTEEGREVRFTYNKNLGYGDEQEENLVKSPSGKPWWLIGRQILAKKKGKSYSPGKDDFEPPSWMIKEKEQKTDAYKESMEEVYLKLRETYVNNLRRLKLKEIVAIVNEAHLGGGEEQETYEKLFVLSSDAEGIRLEASDGSEKPDIEKIKAAAMDKSDIIKTDGAKIIIDIPGMSPLTIHGLKFHNNMLSSKRDDLKIKTR